MSPKKVEKFFKKASQVKLEDKKKDAIHQNVLMYIKENPLRGDEPKTNWLTVFMSNVSQSRFKVPAITFACMMIFLVLGGAVSVKADSALPGDLLYSVKIGINEKIEETLAFSPQAKLDVNIKLAELRLRETEQLASQNKIDSATEAQISQNFRYHANKAYEQLSVQNQAGNNQASGDAAVSFEASLRAHSIIINGLKESNGSDTTGSLAKSVEGIAAKMLSIGNYNNGNNAQEGGSTPAGGQNSTDSKNIVKKITDLENSVNSIRKLINDNKTILGDQAVLDSENNLNLVQQKIDEGKKELSNNNGYAASLSALRQASVIAQESQYLINARSRLGIKIPIGIQLQNGDNGNTDNKQGVGDNGSSNKSDNTDINNGSSTNESAGSGSESQINSGSGSSTESSQNSGTSADSGASINDNTGAGADTSTSTDTTQNTTS